jgi:hypothetical protein
VLFRATAVHLVRGFVHVHVDRNIQLVGVHADFFERRVGNGVGRVRGEGGADEFAVAQLVVQLEALVQVFIGVLRPGAGEVDHDQPDAGAHAGVVARARGDIGEEIHVAEAGGAALQHLGDGELGAVAHEIGADPLRLRRPDVIVQPVHERQVVRQPAEQAHGGVGVCVHQAGDDGMGFQINAFCGAILFGGVFDRQDFDDFPAVDGDTVVIQRLPVGFDGYHPAGVY